MSAILKVAKKNRIKEKKREHLRHERKKKGKVLTREGLIIVKKVGYFAVYPVWLRRKKGELRLPREG